MDHRPAVRGAAAAGTGGHTTRSKLLILRAFDTAAVADRAAFAWNRLSNACHLHAFKMRPAAMEVERLCGVVAELIP
ncbi:hypothetical protein ABQE93_24935 [Mycolicibacterium sp. XJ662]